MRLTGPENPPQVRFRAQALVHPFASTAVIALFFLPGSPPKEDGGRLDHPKAKLTYARGPGAEACPEQLDLERSVRARLGYDPFASEAPLHLSAELVVTGAHLEARLTTEVPGQPPLSWIRDSTGRGCGDLAQALALAICVAVDPLGELAPLQPEVLPSPPATATATTALRRPPALPSEEAPPVPAPSAPQRRLTIVGLGGVVGAIGLTPGPTLGFFLGGELGGPHLRLGLEARLFLPSSLVFTPTAEATVLPLGGALLPCLHASIIGACAVVAVGAVRSSGDGLVQGRVVVTPSVAAGARALIRLAIAGAFELRALAEIDLALVRTAVYVSGVEGWRTPAVAGLLGVAVGWPENP